MSLYRRVTRKNVGFGHLRTMGCSPLSVVVFLIGLAFFTAAAADDWPTFRHDNGRTGVTAEQIALPLTLQWVFLPQHPPVPVQRELDNHRFL
jgi:hypothetical protein